MDQNFEFPIFDFDLDFIADYFTGLNRQGPGSEECTLKALSFVPDRNSIKNVADLGCGTGCQTAHLAAALPNAHIQAIDLLPQMTEGLSRRIAQQDLSNRITAITGSMGELSFDPGSLDLIWAEGSIYNIGFENGFDYWKPFLRSGGCVAVTETCWLGNARPDEMDFMAQNFPEISMISGKIEVIEGSGYIPLAHFILPRECWTVNFYDPMEDYIGKFLDRHGRSETAVRFVEMIRKERSHYQKYGDMYGYVFFIAMKP